MSVHDITDRGLVAEPFTVPEVCHMTGATKHRLRYWDTSGLIHPSIQGTEGRPGKRRLYSWNDVEAVRDILEMLKTKTLQQIRAALIQRSQQIMHRTDADRVALGETIMERLRTVNDGRLF